MSLKCKIKQIKIDIPFMNVTAIVFFGECVIVKSREYFRIVFLKIFFFIFCEILIIAWNVVSQNLLLIDILILI